MFPIISIGPLSLPAPQLILLLGLWLGTALAEKKSQSAGKNPDVLSKIIWTAILSGILGARLSFIARNPFAFQGHWLSVFSLNQALLDPQGGLLIALAAGFFVAERNQVAGWSLLDDIAPAAAVLAPAIFLANFASGSGFGVLTDLPWAIEIWGGPRHPVQLYYLTASLGYLILLVLGKNPLRRKPGSEMLFCVICTSGYLTVLSTFQDPAGHMIGSFRAIQLISWAVFSGSMLIFSKSGTREVNHAPV